VAGPGGRVADWLVHFHPERRLWPDAVRYGFVAAGYGYEFSKTFRRMRPGDQVWVRLTWQGVGGRKAGYVARGIVETLPLPMDRAEIVVDGVRRPFAELLPVLDGDYGVLGTASNDAKWIAGVRWEAVLDEEDRLTYDHVAHAPRVTVGQFHRDRPDHLEVLTLLAASMPVDASMSAPDAPVEPGASETDALAAGRDLAQGQGYAVDTKEVEAVGMDAVEAWFTSRSYDVRLVPELKLGWDLEATHRMTKRKWLVEVKATAGPRPTVLVTANELAKAAANPEWVIAVVTRALAGPDGVRFWTGADVLAEPIAKVYEARLDDDDGTAAPRRSAPHGS